MSYRNYSTAVSHIVDQNGLGDFTTIAAAITAASSGETVFVRPGTYTEDLTLKAGVNLIGATDRNGPLVVGKATYTGGDDVVLSNIELETNGDYALVFSGTSSGSLTLDDVMLTGSDNDIINYTNSNSSSVLLLEYCRSNITDGASTHFISTNPGFLTLNFSIFQRGSSTKASTSSAGLLSMQNSGLSNPLSLTGTAQISAIGWYCDLNTANTTCITFNSSGTTARLLNCYLQSGTAVPITVTSGTLLVDHSWIRSTNAATSDGAGTLSYNLLSMVDTTPGTLDTSTLTGRIGYMGGVSFDGGNNTLNFYEEGTWSPTIAPQSGAFTTITYSTNSGIYTRIGNILVFMINIQVSAFTIGTGSGDIRITGLPYDAAGFTPNLCMVSNLNWDSASYNYLVATGAGSGRLNINEIGDNNTQNKVAVSALNSNTSFWIKGSYAI